MARKGKKGKNSWRTKTSPLLKVAPQHNSQLGLLGAISYRASEICF